MESNDSFESLISLVSSMNDEAHSSSEFDETDFVNKMENYLNSDFESDNEPKINRQESFSRAENLDDEKMIFQGSSLNLKQFSFAFLFLVHKMKLAKIHRENLYRFFKYLLPQSNGLPQSYAGIVKKYLKESIKPRIIKMCNFCEEIMVENSCPNIICKKPESLPKGERNIYETIIFDAKQQIVDGLEKNWEEILAYKGTKYKNCFIYFFKQYFEFLLFI